MLQLNFTPFPALATERLVLRQITQDDVNEIFFLRSDEEVMRYIDRPRALTVAEAAEWIRKITDAQNGNEMIAWGITLKGAARLIGTIGLWNIRTDHCRAETGYVLHPGFHRRGIMQEALAGVIAYGFQKIGLHSIEATVNPGNDASIKILERNNFIKEAYFKENFYFNGKFLDSAVYSLLAP